MQLGLDNTYWLGCNQELGPGHGTPGLPTVNDGPSPICRVALATMTRVIEVLSNAT